MTTDPISSPDAAATKKRPAGRIIVPILLVLAGICGLMYPVVATEYNNYRQREFANKFEQQMAQTSPKEREDALASARAYNSTIQGIPILDPWLSRAGGAPASAAYDNYLKQLGAQEVMARLRIPSIQVNLPIRHGTRDDALNSGVGHLYGTALPVGGAGTHSVLTAHSAIPTATLFDELPKVREGEVFYIDVAGETLAYKVDQIKVVLPDQLGDLKQIAGKDYVTLITCTPYAVNSHRLLVRAERIEYDPKTDVAPSAISAVWRLQWWMWWSIGGALLGIIVLVAMVVTRRRKDRRNS